MTSKERVKAAIHHMPIDRVPTSFQSVKEIEETLKQHFKKDDMEEILDELEIDCRIYYLDFVGNPFFFEKFDDGTMRTIGGTISREISNEFGSYVETVNYVLDGCETIDEAKEKLELPPVNDYDYIGLHEKLIRNKSRYNIVFGGNTFQFLTLWMNTEELLVSLYTNEEFIFYLLERATEFNLQILESALKLSNENIDAVLLADDFATQIAPIMSVEMFRKFFKPFIKRHVDLAKSYDKDVLMHCCGSAYKFIFEYIDLGIDIVDPIQTTAADMDPKKLKNEFGGKIAFCGGVDSQYILPKGTPGQVKENVNDLINVLGADGGYILTSCHSLQADVPIENIIELFKMEHRLAN